jgi:hypothetical protein
MTKVWPVEGRYLNDVPAVAHDCDDPFCVESGAFTTKRPPKADEPEAPAEETPEA